MTQKMVFFVSLSYMLNIYSSCDSKALLNEKLVCSGSWLAYNFDMLVTSNISGKKITSYMKRMTHTLRGNVRWTFE